MKYKLNMKGNEEMEMGREGERENENALMSQKCNGKRERARECFNDLEM